MNCILLKFVATAINSDDQQKYSLKTTKRRHMTWPAFITQSKDVNKCRHSLDRSRSRCPNSERRFRDRTTTRDDVDVLRRSYTATHDKLVATCIPDVVTKHHRRTNRTSGDIFRPVWSKCDVWPTANKASLVSYGVINCRLARVVERTINWINK